jgi:hypothetical protein
MVGKEPSVAAAHPFGRQPITNPVLPVVVTLAIMDSTEDPGAWEHAMEQCCACEPNAAANDSDRSRASCVCSGLTEANVERSDPVR